MPNSSPSRGPNSDITEAFWYLWLHGPTHEGQKHLWAVLEKFIEERRSFKDVERLIQKRHEPLNVTRAKETLEIYLRLYTRAEEDKALGRSAHLRVKVLNLRKHQALSFLHPTAADPLEQVDLTAELGQ